MMVSLVAIVSVMTAVVMLVDVDNVEYRRLWVEEKEVNARLRAELDLLKGKGPYR